MTESKFPTRGIWFKSHACFQDEWAGFDEVRTINVIIGRNNSGKSKLLDVARAAIGSPPAGVRTRRKGVLEGSILEPFFPNQRLDGLPFRTGSAWNDYGRHLIGATLEWETDATGATLTASTDGQVAETLQNNYAKNWDDIMKRMSTRFSVPLSGYSWSHLAAERDIVAEAAGLNLNLELSPNGEGATEIVRAHLGEEERSPKIFQKTVIPALRQLLGDDSAAEIEDIRAYSRGKMGETLWSLWLHQKGRGRDDRVSLSDSGSGLKTLLLVLLHLHMVPAIRSQTGGKFVFAFEELENNLHPALLRRLLRYIEDYALRNDAVFFLTTHSSVMLDVFGGVPHAQIIRVTHDAKTARTETVSHEFERHGVIADLGAKPSDLLQANAILWVEGPSDAIYLNRWIELYCERHRPERTPFREGRDYQCAFYGGALLAHSEIAAADEATSARQNLFKVNGNFLVLCDSDKSNVDSALKERVERLSKEANAYGRALVWITKPKEIENYLPAGALETRAGETPARAPDQFERFWPSERKTEGGDGRTSYLEEVLGRRSVEKVKLAREVAPRLTYETMSARFDWEERMKELITKLEEWNR